MNCFRFDQNIPISMIPFADQMTFSYHINSFEFPTKHSHSDYWEFTIILEGTVNNYTSLKKTTFPMGSVLVSTTEHSHFVLNASKDPLRYINLVVREEYIQKALKLIAPHLLEQIMSGKTQFFLKQRTISELEAMLMNVQIWDPEMLEFNETLMSSAFLLLLSSLVYSTDMPLGETGKWIDNLNEIIRENDYLSLTTNNLCKMLGFSRAKLTDLFKKYFGTTPHDYLLRLKLEHATYLLLNSDTTIAEISERLYYANPAAFYTAFKKAYGVTPHEYKKQMKSSTKEYRH